MAARTRQPRSGQPRLFVSMTVFLAALVLVGLAGCETPRLNPMSGGEIVGVVRLPGTEFANPPGPIPPRLSVPRDLLDEVANSYSSAVVVEGPLTRPADQRFVFWLSDGERIVVDATHDGSDVFRVANYPKNQRTARLVLFAASSEFVTNLDLLANALDAI